MRHADALKRFLHPLAPLLGGHAAIGERQLDVLVHGEIADQVERLEDEADLLVADAGAIGEGEVGDLLLVQPIAAFRRGIEQPEDRQQRRLATAGRAGDRHVLAVADLEVDAGEGVGFDLVGQEDLGHPFELDQRLRGCVHAGSPKEVAPWSSSTGCGRSRPGQRYRRG
jgi:hypothetical protein